MRELIAYAGALALAGCATKVAPALQPLAPISVQPLGQILDRHVQITRDAGLNLPARPGYPEARTLSQLVRAQYGTRRGVFEAGLTLSPDRVDLVITLPSGPRLASMSWDQDAITETRAKGPFQAAPGANMLGDIFLCFWPREAVAAALDRSLEVVDQADGRRLISQDGNLVIEISRAPETPHITRLRNLALDYQLIIETSP